MEVSRTLNKISDLKKGLKDQQRQGHGVDQIGWLHRLGWTQEEVSDKLKELWPDAKELEKEQWAKLGDVVYSWQTVCKRFQGNRGEKCPHSPPHPGQG